MAAITIFIVSSEINTCRMLQTPLTYSIATRIINNIVIFTISHHSFDIWQLNHVFSSRFAKFCWYGHAELHFTAANLLLPIG